ncbi:MAG TPA: ABC transporter permease [Candidatus Acetothermia bacterium]|nr:ABC transporter permease [Candidatus Acetothermia bacterium]
MGAYLVRRLAQGILVLLAVSFICFVIFQYMGDPAGALAGRYATPKQLELVRKKLGLDKPFYVQYLIFLKNALHGNFGMSFVSRLPAMQVIIERLPATLELSLMAMLLAIGLGVSLGVLVSIAPDSLVSRLIMAGSLIGISIPTFLTGILLIMVFAVDLRVLPPFGRGEVVRIFGSWRSGLLTWDGLKHLILPAITLSSYQLAVLLRLTRAGMMEVLGEDYIKTAWAKGLPQRAVLFKHALRNALIPVVTVIGLQFGELIAFSIVTETVFQWPGMGNLLLSAIYESDQPVIVSYITFVSLIILGLNLLVDVLYVFINPKIRYV